MINLGRLPKVSKTKFRKQVRQELARRNLLDFVLYTKPDYQVNWHHRLICEYLTRFADGDIKRLMIFAPPRHGKSQLVSRHLPAFLFGINPDIAVVGGSYGSDLAQMMNRDVQRIIDSPEYAEVFPHTQLFGKNIRTIADGSYLRNSDIFEIVNHTGSYRGAGVGGGLTGRGFDRGIIDDPFKDRMEAASPTIRQNKWDWYSSVFYTRQQPNAGILITHTRWHNDDIAGRLLELQKTSDSADKWEILFLPAIVTDKNKSQLHPDDPRQLGEALWHEWYPLEFLEKVKANNAYEFEALYQQSPLLDGAGSFNPLQIKVVDYVPECEKVVRFWDLAVTARRYGDFTVGLKMGVTKDQQPVILDIWRGQAEFPDVQEAIVQCAHMDGKSVKIRLEAEKAGIIGLDYLLRDKRVNGYTMDKKAPDGDKFTRAQPFATRVNNGHVLMVKANWNRAYLDELATFPGGSNDDQVDASSGAWDMLAQPRRLGWAELNSWGKKEGG